MTNYEKVLNYAREMRKNPTKAEKIFWGKVRNKRFEGEKFYRQYIICSYPKKSDSKLRQKNPLNLLS